MQTVITLLEAAAPDLLDRCLAVRQEVFTREMGVPTDVEREMCIRDRSWTAKSGTCWNLFPRRTPIPNNHT